MYIFLLTNLGIANLVLQDTVERIYAGNLYAEEHVGLYLVRGENVLLLGEIVSLLTSFWLCAQMLMDCLGPRQRR